MICNPDTIMSNPETSRVGPSTPTSFTVTSRARARPSPETPHRTTRTRTARMGHALTLSISLFRPGPARPLIPVDSTYPVPVSMLAYSSIMIGASQDNNASRSSRVHMQRKVLSTRDGTPRIAQSTRDGTPQIARCRTSRSTTGYG
jgi:hypothetical protein